MTRPIKGSSRNLRMVLLVLLGMGMGGLPMDTLLDNTLLDNILHSKGIHRKGIRHKGILRMEGTPHKGILLPDIPLEHTLLLDILGHLLLLTSQVTEEWVFCWLEELLLQQPLMGLTNCPTVPTMSAMGCPMDMVTAMASSSMGSTASSSTGSLGSTGSTGCSRSGSDLEIWCCQKLSVKSG